MTVRKRLEHLPLDTKCKCGRNVATRKCRKGGGYVVQSEKCRVCLNLGQKYGIDVIDRDNMLDDNHGCCELCGNPINFAEVIGGRKRSEQAVVDHCHTSGKLRGILCSTCNLTLGNVKDSPRLLRRMADYLEKHQ